VKSLISASKEFFWPTDIKVRLRRAELTFWAFVLALANIPLPLGFLAWIALIRPLAIISDLRGKSVFKAAYFFALMANIFHLYWLAIVTPPGAVAAIVILALYPAIILSVFVRIYHWKKNIGLIALPILWVGMEYFRSLSQFSFAWTDLSYSQASYLTFIQIASVIGSYGLSFIIVALNIVGWQAIDKANRLERRVSGGIAFISVVTAVYLFGWVVFPPMVKQGNIKTALLQGNIELDMKWSPETRRSNFTIYDSLAQIAARDSVDLIVWPETAAPCYPRVEPVYRNMLAATAIKSRAINLVGAMDVECLDTKQKTYNSVFQFLPDGKISGSYNKVKLVPFSEHVPYQDYLPFLTREFLAKYLTLIRNHQVEWWSDFYPGDSIVLFETGKGAYSALICFESNYPEYVRDCILKGAKFLVNITNDAWFGRTPGPYQHLRIAIFRAVENRIFIARCANSGISAIIDPYGREIARAGLYAQSVIVGGIVPLEEYATFTKIGPVVGRYSLLITAFIFLILFMIWLKSKIIKQPLSRR
jgi:apolipoprotein N-acyltransferase